MKEPSIPFFKTVRAAVVAALAATAVDSAASTAFVRERAGATWQDGLFIGDGATGAMAFQPAHLEWIVNRNDVLDSRVFSCKYTPHAEVMACVATNAGHSVIFLGDGERRTISGPPDGDRLTLSMSAAILRMRFWGGVGWSMPSIPRARQELDTRTGELLAEMSSPSLAPKALSFVERSRDIMVVDAFDPRMPTRGCVVELARPEDPRLEGLPFSWQTGDGLVAFSQAMPGGETYAVALAVSGDVAVRGRTARISTPGSAARRADRKASGRAIAFLAVRTTRDAADPRDAAIAAVRAAAHDGYEKVRADNRAWWRGFWEKGARASFASDETVDTQWNYSLYALASQFGAAPMPALNGLTFGPLDGGNAGVGSHCYVHDQNVQIPMMPFFPLNHADFVRPFVRTYENALPELERHTREIFGVGGVFLPLNMNQFGFEQPTSCYRYTLCGSAYSGLVLCQAWWYTHDEAVLREVYPLLKKFVRFYVETSTRDEKGGWHFIWSVPPEIFTGSRDDTATIACLKPCLETAIEASRRFQCDEAERAAWEDALAHYPSFARHSEGGWWGGPEIPDDHYMYGGHLFYPFFPAESDVDANAARRTLDYYWKYAIEASFETDPPHPVHEWSALYTGIAATRLFGGERGWRALADFYDSFAKPSGLFSHNPIIVTKLTREQMASNLARAPKLVRRGCNGAMQSFSRRGPDDLTWDAGSKALAAPVLEGGAAFLLLANEALLQSWGGELRIFPSVPKGFSGKFENFRARGGYVVSAEMVDGRVVAFDVKGVRDGESVKVSCPTDPSWKR